VERSRLAGRIRPGETEGRRVMIRKAIIILSATLAAVTAVLAALICFWGESCVRLPLSDKILWLQDNYSVHFFWQVPTERAYGYSDNFGSFAGFSYDYIPFSRDVFVEIPLWAPLVLFAVYPAIAIVRGPLRRRHRRKHNQCLHCGYNLTGNVTGICSECGRPIAPRPRSSHGGESAGRSPVGSDAEK
jgi:ribosomal protein L37E